MKPRSLSACVLDRSAPGPAPMKQSRSPFYSDGTEGAESVEEKASNPIDLENSKLNFSYEIVKTFLMALVTFIIHILLGPGTAVATLLTLYFLDCRFAYILNHKFLDKKSLTQQSSTGQTYEETGIPQNFGDIDWLTVSKIPGVDAERLKDTFECLYKRLHNGSLKIEDNGEWTGIDNTDTKFPADKKND